MFLITASSSFISRRWYWNPISRVVLVRSQTLHALLTPLILGVSPDMIDNASLD